VWHHVSTKPIEAGGRGPKELTGTGCLDAMKELRVGPRSA
jgi:transposase